MDIQIVQAICADFHIVIVERVSWYCSVIEEHTCQMPSVVPFGENVLVWVEPYHSKAGVIHAVPTCVVDPNAELALARLADDVYRDYLIDVQSLQMMSLSAVVG